MAQQDPKPEDLSLTTQSGDRPGTAYLDTVSGNVYTAAVASNTGTTQWNLVGTSSAPWNTGSITSGSINYGSTPLLTCPAGHETDPNYAEYLDGVIAATCLHCGQRITFKALPGGIPLLRLKALMERLMAGDKSGALEDFAYVNEALDLERQALVIAESLVALAKTMLERD